MKIVCLALFLFSSQLQVMSQHTEAKLPATDQAWIKTVLRNWDSVCRYNLGLVPGDLPWIIFYDSAAAWHLHPDEKLLPSHARSSYRFQFAQKNYDVYRVNNTPSIWLPGRKPIELSSMVASTMPYGNNKKVYFIAPLPSLFHRVAPSDQVFFLDLLLIGLCSHELTHTLQLPFVLPQLTKIQQQYRLPENIDDNSIENIFSKDETYLKLFNEEKGHLWTAVSSADDATCKSEILKALSLKEQRHKLFTGDNTGFKHLDEIFLSLEGSAMWVQYQVTLSHAPEDQPWQETLNWLWERTSSWSQEEGLALFLLINRLVPDWKKQFFKKELPSPFKILQEAAK